MIRLSIIIMLCTHPVMAEPWLGSRFAQNCAGCHAPGRKNVKPMDRRCTLACQGCHVSPQGGGLRSEYGKWNQDRWLRSLRLPIQKSTKATAYYKDQLYGQAPWEKADQKQKNEFSSQGADHIDLDKTAVDESKYDRRDGLEFIISKSRKEFTYQIPKDDPYRQRKENNIIAGADLRWQIKKTTQEVDGESTETWLNFPMSADIGLSWRPLYNNNLRLTYEGRAFGSPALENKPENLMTTYSRRSLYVMLENLPFATYLMTGFYRPIFGNYVPDHTQLAQRMLAKATHSSGKAYNMQYQAVSVGGSPNVPFANFHLITKELNGSNIDNSYKGYAANLGGRFVTMGLAVNYSFWANNQDVDTGSGKVTAKTQLHALGASAHLFKLLTVTLEGISFAKDIPDQDFRQGAVYSAEAFLKIWRQIYFNTQFALANRDEDLYPGSGQQLRIGLRAFWLTGFETMIHYTQDTQTSAARGNNPESERTESGILYQIHMFI